MAIKKKKGYFGEKGSAEIVKIFAMVANTDTTEGRGSNVDRSYHLTEEGAMEAARGKGIFGGDAEAQPRLAIHFISSGNYFLLANHKTIPAESAPLITVNTISPAQKKAIAQRARAKLSKAEMTALGVKK